MAPAWSEIRTTMRLDGSLARMRERRRAADEAARGASSMLPRGSVLTVLGWGAPLALVFFAAAATSWVPAIGVVVLGSVWHGMGARATKTTFFEALRLPSLTAMVLARIARRLPWLLWCGACLAAIVRTRLALAGWAEDPWTWPLVAAAFLGPVFAMVRGASFAAFDRTAESRGATPVGCVALLVAWLVLQASVERLFQVRHAFYLTWWVWWIGWSSASGLLRRGRFAQSFPLAFVDVLALLPAGYVVGAAPHALAAIPATALHAYAAIALAWVVLGGVHLTADAIRCAATCDVVEVGRSAGGPDAESGVRATAVACRRRPARGLWTASWEAWRRREILRPPGPEESRAEPIGSWCALALSWVVLVFRAVAGPALGAVAVLAAGDASGPALAVALAAGAAFASRTYVGERLSERLHLLGVDYVVQARQEIRARLLVAAPPTLAAALGAAWWRGFAPDACLAAAAVAAFLLLRAGWPGLGRARVRVAGCLVVAAVVPLFLLPHATWVLGAAAAAVGFAGAFGLTRRWMRLDEARLRDEMRAAAAAASTADATAARTA